MKNRHVVLFVVLGCFLLVGNAFANFPSSRPPQVRAHYTFDGNNSTPTGLVQDTRGNFFGVDQSRVPNRCGSMFLAFRQQEVDPTWYDPWAPKVVEQASHPHVAAHKNHLKTGSAPSVQRKSPVRQSSQEGRREAKLGNR
ncbi:MAG: hypothetical protein WCC22_20025 [Terriglobales bacterium]